MPRGQTRAKKQQKGGGHAVIYSDRMIYGLWKKHNTYVRRRASSFIGRTQNGVYIKVTKNTNEKSWWMREGEVTFPFPKTRAGTGYTAPN